MARFSKWLKKVSADDRTVDVAVRALDQRSSGVLHFFPKAARQWQCDPEYVHELRVWTRRSAAVLEIFEGVFPAKRAAWLNQQFRRIRKAANEARDLDVLIDRFQKRNDGALAPLLETLKTRRVTAQKPLRRVFKQLLADGNFATKLKSTLRKTKRQRKTPEWKDVRFGTWSKDRLANLFASFLERAHGDLSSIEALHQLRIAGKELRYAIELFAPAFAKPLRTTAYDKVAELQQLLGTINDHAVTLHRFEQWQTEADSNIASAVLQALISEEEAALNQSREEFFLWWTEDCLNDLVSRFEEILGNVELAQQETPDDAPVETVDQPPANPL